MRARHDSIAEEREKKISHFTEKLREDKLKLADALIEHAHTYHPPLRFMLGVEKRASDVISQNLRKLLIAELGDCDQIARETILHDPQIRKVCLPGSRPPTCAFILFSPSRPCLS